MTKEQIHQQALNFSNAGMCNAFSFIMGASWASEEQQKEDIEKLQRFLLAHKEDYLRLSYECNITKDGDKLTVSPCLTEAIYEDMANAIKQQQL